MSTSESNPLFKPFECKSLQLKNRFVMAPMTRGMSPGGVPGPDVAAYYRRRAEGGVGLIITEGTTIDRPAASSDASIPNFYAWESLLGWENVVSQVHEAGGMIAPQLWHQGLLRQPGTGPFPESPSEGPSRGTQGTVGMTDEDIADTVHAFSNAAAAAQRIGFDAVELHGAHGYLIDQFFWKGTNQRNDRFGGDLARRSLFATEVVRAVRASVGPDFRSACVSRSGGFRTMRVSLRKHRRNLKICSCRSRRPGSICFTRRHVGSGCRSSLDPHSILRDGQKS